MPTFSPTCTNQLAASPNATRLLNESLARVAMRTDAQEQDQEERERQRDADEAQLLADDREDEVGMLGRAGTPAASACPS